MQFLQQSAAKNEYLVKIGVGTPVQNLSVTLDTGSSDLWIPVTQSTNCRKSHCDAGSFDSSQSSTFQVVAEGGFNITYAGPDDSNAGDWAADVVVVAGGAELSNTQFGLAVEGYDNHGVLGIGYDTNEAYSPNGDYPSIMDQMVAQGLIRRKAYSVHLDKWQDSTGSLIFGGIDSTRYSGRLMALPLQPNPQGNISEFFVTLTSVSFTDATGRSTQLSPEGYSQAVLLDTGTTATLLTNDVLEQLVTGVGAVIYDQYGDMVIPCQLRQTNASIDYEFGGSPGVVIRVPMSQATGMQIMSDKAFSESSGGCEFSFGPPIEGVSILGDSFLRSAYAVFDLDNNMAALAQANVDRPQTSSVSVIPQGTDIPGVTRTLSVSGTQLTGVSATDAWLAPLASMSDGVVIAGMPTFNFGVDARATGSSASMASHKINSSSTTQMVLVLVVLSCCLTGF